MGEGTIHENANRLLESTKGEIEELQTEYDRINEQYKDLGAQRESLGSAIRHLKYLANDLQSYLNSYGD